jgi:exodeoxyribonuclease-3
MTLKIVTWNVNSVNARLNHLIELINEQKPDIICLQELKCENHKFPEDEIADFYYNCYLNGQKSYNGVAILSNIVADDVLTNFPGNPIPEQSRYIEINLMTEIGYCRIISLYAPNGGEVNSDKFKIKLDFYDAFTKYLESTVSFDQQLIICSDFNIAAFDIDIYDPDKLRHSTCFTIEEKKKFRRILNMGFIDNYRLLHPDEQEFTWWDYRAGSFEQNKGYRIDTILSTSNVVKNIKDCFVDHKTREKSKSSDHAPVIVTYEN